MYVDVRRASHESEKRAQKKGVRELARVPVQNQFHDDDDDDEAFDFSQNKPKQAQANKSKP